jgi:hypothetical protein
MLAAAVPRRTFGEQFVSRRGLWGNAMNSWQSWRAAWVVALLAVLCFAGSSLAGSGDNDEEQQGPGKGKGKGKGKGPAIVKVDLSKMPKELARQVKDYIVADEAPKAKGEYKKFDFKKGDFKKYWEKYKLKEEPKSSTSKIEQRLDQLIQEIEAIRKELKKKK